MAFDLYAIESATLAYLKAQFPAYPFYTNAVPEDELMPRTNDEVLPFFVVQNGPLWPRPRGKAVAGARHDEYYSWVQLICISSVEEQAAAALAMVTDKLVGYRTSLHTAFIPDGSGSDYGSRQYSVRPVVYFRSQRFEFNLKATPTPLTP